SAILLFYSILVIPAGSTLFPYTTLFRSKPRRGATPASRGRPDPSPGTGRTGRTGEGNRAPSLRWGTATRRPGSTPGQTTLPGVGGRTDRCPGPRQRDNGRGAPAGDEPGRMRGLVGHPRRQCTRGP